MTNSANTKPGNRTVFQLADATWPEAGANARRALVVPLGSVEQHGPHLPLDTDTRIAIAVGAGIAAGRAGVALAPAIAFGSSGEHAGFPGTLSIGTPALSDLLVDLGRDAARDWGALLFVSAHGGNHDAVCTALPQLRAEGRRCAAFAAVPAAGDAHAGRTETSILLHLDPGAVRLDLAKPGDTRPLSELIDRLRSDGVRTVSPNGVLGDPRGATADEGSRLLTQVIAAGTTALDELLAGVPIPDEDRLTERPAHA